jgi:nitric oxide synthase-interacting protein
MSKHSKNNAAKSVFTSHERNRKLGISSGTEKLRLGHDSMKPFDACSITLEPVVNPVADQQGHIYSKTAIYDHMMDQKRMYDVQLKAYKKEQEQLKVCPILFLFNLCFVQFQSPAFISCLFSCEMS